MPSAPTAQPNHRRRRIAVLLAGAAAALALAAWATHQPQARWQEWLDLGRGALDRIRTLGAGWFFAAFALLPALGAPVSVFAFSAAPLFSPSLGLGGVLTLSSACMATSMSLSYALARWTLRPWVERLLSFLGYKTPTVPPDKAKLFTLLVRVTPGPPYVLQNLLLGLANVPFKPYMIVSWPVCTTTVILFTLFGDAVVQGQGQKALLTLAGLAAIAAGLKLARTALTKRSNPDLEKERGEI